MGTPISDDRIFDRFVDFCFGSDDEIENFSPEKLEADLAEDGIVVERLIGSMNKMIAKAKAKESLQLAEQHRSEMLAHQAPNLQLKFDLGEAKRIFLLNAESSFAQAYARNYTGKSEADLNTMLEDYWRIGGVSSQAALGQGNREPDILTAQVTAGKLIDGFFMSRPEEIELENIAMALGILVIDGELETSDARLVRNSDKGIIRVNANLSNEGRRRFAIAHEVGHWMLHSNQSQLDLCVDLDIKGYQGSFMEAEANAFAAVLLMPSRLVGPRCFSADPNFKLVNELARDFRVSFTAAAIRFVEESRENCLVVFSEKNRVKWWRRKNQYAGLGLESKFELRRESAAWRCLNEGLASVPMRRIPNEVWFPQWEDKYDVSVQEEAIMLPAYGICVSLLWVIGDPSS